MFIRDDGSQLKGYRLQFDQPIQSKLLGAISRMGWYSRSNCMSFINLLVSFSARKLNKWTINWNRLILLWGPPGTGKTSFWCAPSTIDVDQG